MAYAEGTTVSIEKSRAEIEAMLVKHGADQFMSGWKDGAASIMFRSNSRYIRFLLKLPDPYDPRFKKSPSGRYGVSADQARKYWEQECRSLWRALALCIKAKLEAVASGITTFESEFLSHTVLPNGRTVADEALPRLEQAYRDGKVSDPLPMLCGPSEEPKKPNPPANKKDQPRVVEGTIEPR